MTHQDETETPTRPSLYDRLGGVYNIAPVVDNLIDHVMIDPRLNANPRVDEAPSSSIGSGLQILRYRDALRGRWWTPALLWSADGRLPPRPHDY